MQLFTKSSTVLTLLMLMFTANINAKSLIKVTEPQINSSISDVNEHFVGKWVLDKVIDKDKKSVATLPLTSFEIELMLNGKCKISFGNDQGKTELADIAWSTKDVFGLKNAWIASDVHADKKLTGVTIPFPFSQFTGVIFSPGTLNGATVFDHIEWIVDYKGQQYTVCLKKV